MTVSQAFALQIAGGSLAIIIVLVGVIWGMLIARINRMEKHINERLRSLGHEDRELHNSITGLLTIIETHSQKTMESILRGNQLSVSMMAMVRGSGAEKFDMDSRKG